MLIRLWDLGLVEEELGGMAQVCQPVMLLLEPTKTLSPIQTNNFRASRTSVRALQHLKPIPLTGILRSVCVALGEAILMQLQTYFIFLMSPNKTYKSLNHMLLH